MKQAKLNHGVCGECDLIIDKLPTGDFRLKMNTQMSDKCCIMNGKPRCDFLKDLKIKNSEFLRLQELPQGQVHSLPSSQWVEK